MTSDEVEAIKRVAAALRSLPVGGQVGVPVPSDSEEVQRLRALLATRERELEDLGRELNHTSAELANERMERLVLQERIQPVRGVTERLGNAALGLFLFAASYFLYLLPDSGAAVVAVKPLLLTSMPILGIFVLVRAVNAPTERGAPLRAKSTSN